MKFNGNLFTFIILNPQPRDARTKIGQQCAFPNGLSHFGKAQFPPTRARTSPTLERSLWSQDFPKNWISPNGLPKKGPRLPPNFVVL